MFSYADAFISRSIKCFHEVICQERFETCVPYFFVLENLCIPREYAVPEHLDNCSNYNVNHNIKESLLTESSNKKLRLSSFTGLIASQAVERTELLRRVISARFAELPETRKRVEQFFPNIPNSENYIHGTGFKSFSESTGLIKWLGIMDSKIPEFLDYILSSIEVSLDQKEKYIKMISHIKYSTFQELTENNLIYAVGESNCRYSKIIAIRNKDLMTTDWYIANINLKFVLAPNIIFLRTHKSSFFGLFQSTETKIQEIPQSLTYEFLKR